MNSRSAYRFSGAGGGSRGFSLVELLAVMAIISVLMAMMAPAMRSFSETAGRRGAVTTVMNTLEQARVAALEKGRDVYVIFYRQATPDEDRMVVVGEPESGTEYEALTKWLKLPKGVIFFQPGAGNSLFGSTLDSAVAGNLPANLKSAQAIGGMSAIKFNASGQAASPDSAHLILHISEGVRDSSGGVARINVERQALPFEIITLSKYTGRAQLDVTELAQN